MMEKVVTLVMILMTELSLDTGGGRNVGDSCRTDGGSHILGTDPVIQQS